MANSLQASGRLAEAERVLWQLYESTDELELAGLVPYLDLFPDGACIEPVEFIELLGTLQSQRPDDLALRRVYAHLTCENTDMRPSLDVLLQAAETLRVEHPVSVCSRGCSAIVLAT